MRESPLLDPRIFSLAIARMVSALANSFLVVVLPLYIGSQAVRLPALTGSAVSVLGVRIAVSVELLIAIVLSLFGFLNSLSQPLTGSLSDRTGRRKPFLLFGLALVASGSAGYLIFTDYLLVLAMRGLQGIGAAFSIPISVALVNELSDPEERGNNFGLFNTFRLLGFGVGPLVAGVVVAGGPYVLTGRSISGFDAAFLVAVVGAAVSFALITLLISDPERAEETAGEDISIRVRGEHGGLDPVFALGVATIVMALSIAIYAPLANVINERLNQGSFLYSIQFGATVLANVLFQLPLGRLSDTYGRRPFLIGGFILLLPTTLAQGLVTSSTGMIVARFLQGVAVAAVFAPSLALAGDLAREGASGSTLSLLTMGFGLGIAVGTLLSGVLVSFGFVVPFIVATAGGAIGLVLVITQVVEPDSDETVAAPAGD
ncbi:MFS transporter [Halobellus ordinarius]|uniref:MFS transporter n=1 Tax=Halobellus ordinarius TaxID=3075120 RepID=UPI0028807234|nr:MFS transporter [Halobellus sp. ZY16]